MWILQCKNNSEIIFPLATDGKEYSIGRKDCSICLEEKSISRLHCSIKIITQKDSSGNERLLLCIKDHSKFGTYIGKDLTRINESFQHCLSHSDISIRFGPQSREYSVEKLRVNVCFSGCKFEFPFCQDEWTKECTHLVMPVITLTQKALLCLLDAKPIVSPEWLAVLQQSGKGIGQENAHLPELGQVLGGKIRKEMFHPNEGRKNLFSAKLFVFFSQEQLGKFAKTLEYAQARIELFNGSLQDLENGAILIANPLCPSELHKWLNEEEEIGLAILECSVQKFKEYQKPPTLSGFSEKQAALLESGKQAALVQSENRPPLVVISANSILTNTKRFKKIYQIPQNPQIIPVGKPNSENHPSKKPKIIDDWLQSENVQNACQPVPSSSIRNVKPFSSPQTEQNSSPKFTSPFFQSRFQNKL